MAICKCGKPLYGAYSLVVKLRSVDPATRVRSSLGTPKIRYNNPMTTKKIIAFDLDGTLTESKQTITQEMADLLCNLSLKVKIAIISGGAYHQFKRQLIPQIIASTCEKNFFNITLLPTSGSCRYEYNSKIDDWYEVYTHPFSNNTKDRVVAELNKILENKAEFEIPEEHFGTYLEDRGNQVTLSALGQEAPLQKKKLWDPDASKRKKIKEALEKAVPEIDANIGGTTSVDILPKGFDKAVGLKILLQDKEMSLEDMLFIGDAIFEGGNDYPPLQAGIESKLIKGPTETAEIIKALL